MSKARAAFERLVNDMERQCAMGVAEREDIESVRAALRTGGQQEESRIEDAFLAGFAAGERAPSRDAKHAMKALAEYRIAAGYTLGDSKGEG